MSTKPTAARYRIRRSGAQAREAAPTAPQPVQQPSQARPNNAQGAAQQQRPQQPAPANAAVDGPAVTAAETEIDAIRKEGLTGRQLRMARRVAQQQGLAVTSDFDAVRQLRQRGIDPFTRNNVLELVTQPKQEQGGQKTPQGGQQRAQVPATTGNKLPQTVVQKTNLPSTQVAQQDPVVERERAISKIQKDIARRRRRNMMALAARLFVFVFLPTAVAGYYFYQMATPMYATNSEFIIQQSESSSASGGMGGLFGGAGLTMQTDATTVQSYLSSRDAMQRLDTDYGFKEQFQNPDIDPIQRLDPNATNEETYEVYKDRVLVGYDPTEGIIRMEVIAPDPQASQTFSEALIGYAEERVDQLTQRMREDQMTDAIANYENAEADRQAARSALTEAQIDATVLDPVGSVNALQQRISTLELELDQRFIELSTLEARTRPNQARVDAVNGQIDRITQQIEALRNQVSQGQEGNASQAETIARLREAEENYQFTVERVAAAQAAMDAASLEASRQVRFLSVSIAPIAPDEPTYPRAFENTVLAFLIFAGVYLMLSLTASILREQVSS